MMLLNQPFNGQLGDILATKMGQPFNRLTILSAFAKNSGVLRMKPAIETFTSNGGTITAFIGLDAHGTSYEALLNLFHLCDSLYVIHSESPITTFYSKIYALSNENSMWLAVGSNNFTAEVFGLTLKAQVALISTLRKLSFKIIKPPCCL